MASANHDNNHILLSRKILDPVASAATNGSKVTSALRNDYLNKANSFIQRFFYALEDKRPGISGKWIQGLITAGSGTFSASGLSVASGFVYALSAQSPTAELYQVNPDKWLRIQARDATYLDSIFTIFGGKIYASQSGAVLSSGTCSYYYITNDQRASAGDTADIAIDSTWYDVIIDIAASFHFEDKGEIAFADAQTKRTQLILSIIGG